MATEKIQFRTWCEGYPNHRGDGVKGENRPMTPTESAAAVEANNLVRAIPIDVSLDDIGSTLWPTIESKADWLYDMPRGDYGRVEKINYPIRSELLGRHPSQRDLLFLFPLRTGIAPYEGNFHATPANILDWAEHGNPLSPSTERLIERYAARMYADGIRPSFIWMDFDTTQTLDGAVFGYPEWSIAGMAFMLASQRARYVVPWSVRQHSAGQIMTRGTAGFHAWNAWARGLQARDIRRAVLRPLGKYFPDFLDYRKAPFINIGFQRVNRKNTFVDDQGAKISPAYGQPWISPYTTEYSVYSSFNGDFTPASPGTSGPWAQLVNMVNLCRRTHNSGFEFVTQVGVPTYSGDAAIDAQRDRLFWSTIYQLAAHGVSRIQLFAGNCERAPNQLDAAAVPGNGRFDATNTNLTDRPGWYFHATVAQVRAIATGVNGLYQNIFARRRRDWPMVNQADGTIQTGTYQTTFASIFSSGTGGPMPSPDDGNTNP